MGTILPPSRGETDAQRRSQRVMLKVSVVVLESSRVLIFPQSYELCMPEPICIRLSLGKGKAQTL